MNKSRFYVKIISLILIAIISVTFITVVFKSSEPAMAETTEKCRTRLTNFIRDITNRIWEYKNIQIL